MLIRNEQDDGHPKIQVQLPARTKHGMRSPNRYEVAVDTSLAGRRWRNCWPSNAATEIAKHCRS